MAGVDGGEGKDSLRTIEEMDQLERKARGGGYYDYTSLREEEKRTINEVRR